MSKNKRYYFFKTFDNFNHTPEHLYLRRQENGLAYIYLYTIMCKMALNHDGKLEFPLGQEVIPYTDKDIAKEADLPIDTVQMGILHLHKANLVERLVDGTFYITQYEKMVGSETDSAQRMRASRKRVKEAAKYKLNTQKNDAIPKLTNGTQNDKKWY